jgi:S1-C subfamily serine protease
MLVGSRELVIPGNKQGKLMDVEMPRFPMPSYDYLVYTEYESLPGERVKLGVRMKEEDGKVIVEEVVPNSAADIAGVKGGDIVVAFDDVDIRENFDLVYEINQHVIGDKIVLVLERKGKQIELDITFTSLPKADAHKP